MTRKKALFEVLWLVLHKIKTAKRNCWFPIQLVRLCLKPFGNIFSFLTAAKTLIWTHALLCEVLLLQLFDCGYCRKDYRYVLKGELSGLRHFLVIESPLKIFKFLCWLFGHVAKRLDQEDKVDFKFYDVTAWLTNNCNTYINHYLEK